MLDISTPDNAVFLFFSVAMVYSAEYLNELAAMNWRWSYTHHNPWHYVFYCYTEHVCILFLDLFQSSNTLIQKECSFH